MVTITVNTESYIGRIDGDILLLLIYSDTTATPFLHQCLARGSGLGKRNLATTGIQRTTMHKSRGCSIEQAEGDAVPSERGRNKYTRDAHRSWKRLRSAK
jgi:hypothetical protein